MEQSIDYLSINQSVVIRNKQTNVRPAATQRRLEHTQHKNTTQHYAETKKHQALLLTRENQGKARTQSPTTTNYAVEFPAFGEIAGVSTPGVQWMSLTLGEPP